MNEIPYWKLKGYKSEESYRESKRRYTKKRNKPTGYQTIYMIYKKDKSEFYIGITLSQLHRRVWRHFAGGTNIYSPFTGKSRKDYCSVVLHTCDTRKEALDIESKVISNLTGDIRMLNKRGR